MSSYGPDAAWEGTWLPNSYPECFLRSYGWIRRDYVIIILHVFIVFVTLVFFMFINVIMIIMMWLRKTFCSLISPGCYGSYRWATWTADSPWSPRVAADGYGTHKNLEGRAMIRHGGTSHFMVI